MIIDHQKEVSIMLTNLDMDRIYPSQVDRPSNLIVPSNLLAIRDPLHKVDLKPDQNFVDVQAPARLAFGGQHGARNRNNAR